MKKTFYVTVSALLSLFIHWLMLYAAGNVEFATFEKVLEDPKRPPLSIRTVDLRKLMEQQRQRRFSQDPEETKRQLSRAVRNHEKIKELFEREELMEKPRPKLVLKGLGENILKRQLEAPAPPREASAPRPSIVSIKAEGLPLARRAQRPVVKAVPRSESSAKVLPSLVPDGRLASAVGKTYDASMRLNLPATAPLNVGPLPPGSEFERDDDAGRGPGTSLSPRGARIPDLPGISADGRAGGGRLYGDVIGALDELMDVEMYVYEEPGGGGVFRVDISPNPQSDRLRAVPKDILFLIDCSTSISVPKLAQFKAATVAGLEYLNRNDRFSIASFREHPEAVITGYVAVTPENIARAQEGVKSLAHGGMTDVFAGLAPYVDVDPDEVRRQRPLNVFLMSDGKSTVKNKLSNDALIRKIYRMNRANVSIYSFSAGRNANLFLLDFLAHHNRGQSLHQDSLSEFQQELVRFIANHSDLIVADLSYQVTGGLDDDIFPKRLPHLYRGETLSIYGRYPAATEDVALSLMGRGASGKREELIFRVKIKDCPKATDQLALDWAGRKVYHLIGRRTLQELPEIGVQIRQLADRYGLYIPYSY